MTTTTYDSAPWIQGGSHRPLELDLSCFGQDALVKCKVYSEVCSVLRVSDPTAGFGQIRRVSSCFTQTPGSNQVTIITPTTFFLIHKS